MSKPLHIHISFPLNVYAHSLYLQQGRVDYLHYGLAEETEDAWEVGALAVQQRSTDLLLAHLPPPPCRILEVGLGLGTLAALLTERGYQVTGISPDPYQITLSEERAGGRFKIKCVPFEEFNTHAQSFEVILLQESAQYLNSLILFNKAYNLLCDHGLLLIVDEVSLRRTPNDDSEGLPLLKDSLSQAEHCGFKLLKHLDLSKKALPTLDYLLKVIKKHRERLLTDLQLSEQKLENLLSSLLVYQQKYRDGRYGYVLLAFQKSRKHAER